MKTTLNLGAILLFVFASACGGGGSGTGNSPTPTPAPTPAPLPKRIVYCQRGKNKTDLYAINEDGTGEVALATSPDDDEICWDPVTHAPAIVGNRVIYRRSLPGGPRYDIYSVKSDGTGTVNLSAAVDSSSTYTHEGFLAILGNQVIISRGELGFLVVNADGGNPVLFEGSTFEGTAFGWVYFNTGRRFYSIRPDGSDRVELLRFESHLVKRDTPTMDGVPLQSESRMFYSDDIAGNAIEFYSSPADATSADHLLSGCYLGQGNFNPFSAISYACLAGNRFIYQVKRSDNTTHLLSIDQGGYGQLSLGDPLPGEVLFTGAIGKYVVFELKGADSSALYGIDVTNSTTSRLTEGRSGMISGDRAISVTTRSDGTFDVSSIHPDGASKVTLAESASLFFDRNYYLMSAPWYNRYPALGYLGNRIFFRKQIGVTSQGPSSDLFSINNDGTGLVTLDAGGKKDTEFLGPDRLYFSRIDNGQQRDLYSILPDGTDRVTLANGAADERFGMLVGTKVVFTRAAADGHRDLYIVNGDGTQEKLLSNNADDKQPIAVF